jgi:hypothetical protein
MTISAISSVEFYMQKHTTHREMYDPFAHYIRGVLFFNEETFTFKAHRVPYLELNEKTWETEQAFIDDYSKLIARKYST